MGIFDYFRSIFQQEHINKSGRDKSYKESDTSRQGYSNTSISQKEFNLDQWILSQQQQYGSRPGLREKLDKMAKAYNSELLGINGAILDDLYCSPFVKKDLSWKDLN